MCLQHTVRCEGGGYITLVDTQACHLTVLLRDHAVLRCTIVCALPLLSAVDVQVWLRLYIEYARLTKQEQSA